MRCPSTGGVPAAALRSRRSPVPAAGGVAGTIRRTGRHRAVAALRRTGRSRPVPGSPAGAAAVRSNGRTIHRRCARRGSWPGSGRRDLPAAGSRLPGPAPAMQARVGRCRAAGRACAATAADLPAPAERPSRCGCRACWWYASSCACRHPPKRVRLPRWRHRAGYGPTAGAARRAGDRRRVRSCGHIRARRARQRREQGGRRDGVSGGR